MSVGNQKMNHIRTWLLVTSAAAVCASGFAAGKGDPEKGKAVFEQCAVCHDPDTDTKDEKKIGPGLKGLFKRDKMSSNSKKPTEANVRARIDEGGNGMPPYKDMLSDQEKDDLIAYLKTL
jgi:cytochrome c